MGFLWKTGKQETKGGKKLKVAKSLKALSKAMRHKKEDVRKEATLKLHILLNEAREKLNLEEKKIDGTRYPVVTDCRVFCAIANVSDLGALRFPLKNYKNIADSVACCYSAIAKPSKAVTKGRVVCASCSEDFSRVKFVANSKKMYYSPTGSAIHCANCNSTDGLYVYTKK
ncbi:MAG: hypothetical protein ACYSRP_07830 [Planctomycetota bacterium]|jgi:hypothetical protein